MIGHKTTLTGFILCSFNHPNCFTISTGALPLQSLLQWLQTSSQAGTVHWQHKSVSDIQTPASRHPCYSCHVYVVTGVHAYVTPFQDWHISSPSFTWKDRISPCFPGCLAQYLVSWFNILIYLKNFTLSLDILNFLTFSHHENGRYFNTPNLPYLTKGKAHASPLFLRLLCLCLASDFIKDSFIFQEHFLYFFCLFHKHSSRLVQKCIPLKNAFSITL